MTEARRGMTRENMVATVEIVNQVAAAIRERCTCTDRPAGLPTLEGHEPDCSLQNTGWMS